MFDRVSDLSDSLSGGSGAGEDAEYGEVGEILRDGERVAHVLASDGSIEHTKDGRTTTVESSGDDRAYALVTDERVLYLLGEQPDEAEIALDLSEFKASHVRKGLLNSKLLVKTGEESVLFAPDEGDLEAAAEYVDRVGSAWADMSAALAKARRSMSEFEAACESGSDPSSRMLNVGSHLSEARHCATRANDAPDGKMRDYVDDVAAELDRREVEAWLDRAEDLVDAIESARDDGRYDEAYAAYVDAASAVESGRQAIEDADSLPEAVTDRFDAVEAAVDEAGETLLDEAAANCERALSAEDPSTAVDAWQDAFERYSAAADAGWNGYAEIDADTIELQLTWVTASLLEALETHAETLERQGDDCDDEGEALEFYEDAESYYERAKEVAGECETAEPDGFEAALERVEEKQLESSGWEFGKA